MSNNIHYFQRYTQKENVVTNNTMLLLKRIYSYNPTIFYKFLYDLVFKDSPNNPASSEEDLTLIFKNQAKGEKSVPDALIKQPSIEIIVETKRRGTDFKSSQLRNHLNSFDEATAYKVLLALSDSDEIDGGIENDLKVACKELNIIFTVASFEKLIKCLEKYINQYEFEVKEMIEDFFEFCRDAGVIKDIWLIARTSGWSFNNDKKYGYYHDGYGRDYDVNFFGLYKDKAIQCVGKVEKVIAVRNGEFERVVQSYDGKTKLTQEQEDRLNEIIKVERTIDAYIYLVDRFYETNFYKSTSYGIQSKKYFNVNKLLKKLGKDDVKELTAQELANLIKDKTWEQMGD